MSRIGRQLVRVPEAVQVDVAGARLRFTGALGEMEHEIPDELEAEYSVQDRTIGLRRKNETAFARSQHGLHRMLIANKVRGVSLGFEKRLEIHGTGYNVNLRGNTLVLQLGFCHEVPLDLPDGITVEIEQNAVQGDNPAKFAVKGIDKQKVGQFAARVRALRPPEPYKGKGVRYVGEYVRRKEGKAFTGLGG